MSNYLLNISTGIIHKAGNSCSACKRLKEENSKEFETYDEAFNFFNGNNKKGKKCGICFREVRIEG